MTLNKITSTHPKLVFMSLFIYLFIIGLIGVELIRDFSLLRHRIRLNNILNLIQPNSCTLILNFFFNKDTNNTGSVSFFKITVL